MIENCVINYKAFSLILKSIPKKFKNSNDIRKRPQEFQKIHKTFLQSYKKSTKMSIHY